MAHKSGARLSSLDGVRAVAVLVVFFSHSIGDRLPGGYVGVDVFFALSGYLITSLLFREWESTGRIALGAFYARRALRLYPALVLSLAIVAVITPVLGVSWRLYGIDAATALTYTYDFWRLTPDHDTLIGPFWSLCVEEQYYLLWPLLLSWLLRRGTTAAIRGTAVAAAVAFAVQASLLPVLGGRNLYFLPLGHADELLIGSLLGLVLAARPVPRLRRLLTGPASWLAWVAIAVVALKGTNSQSSWLYLGGLAAIACCACLIIGHLVLRQSSLMSRLLNWQPLVWLGERSYAFYLLHFALFALFRDFGLPYREVLPAALLCNVVLIGLSFRFVEKPILQRYKRPRERAALIPGAFGSVP